MAIMMSSSSKAAGGDLSTYMEDLKVIKEEFELYKSELNFLRAKKTKIETLARRD
jgi:hypothetical protein